MCSSGVIKLVHHYQRDDQESEAEKCLQKSKELRHNHNGHKKIRTASEIL